tara:strand:- start:107 stop:394 length:288 start_codon:yes stop_codon:yes gene_type:complete
MLTVKDIKAKLARGEQLTREEKLKLVKKPKVENPKMTIASRLRKKETEEIAKRNPGKDAVKLYNLLHRARVKNRMARRFKRGVHRKNLDRAVKGK